MSSYSQQRDFNVYTHNRSAQQEWPEVDLCLIPKMVEKTLNLSFSHHLDYDPMTSMVP